MATLEPDTGEVNHGGGAVTKRTEAEVAQAQICSTCRAWVPIKSQHAEIGRCHRRAPLVVHGQETDTLEGYTDTVWPETMPDEFCCDWLSREPPR